MFLLTTFIILKVFNAYEISLWYMFASATAFSHYFEFGIGPTIIRFIAYSNSENEKIELYKTIGASISVYFFLSLIVMIFSFVFVNYADNSTDVDISLVFWLYPLLNATNFFLKFSDSTLKGCGYLLKYNYWNSIFFLTNSVLVSLVVFFSRSVDYSLLALHFLLTLNGLKNFLIVKHVIKIEKIRAYLSFDHVKQKLGEYLKPTVETAMMSISSTGLGQAINIFLPALVGVNFASAYFVCQKILRVIDEFSYGPFYSYVPEFMQTWGRSNSIQNYRIVIIKTIVFSLVMIAVLGSLLHPLLDLFVPYFNLNITVFPFWVLMLMTILFLLERGSGFVSQMFLIRNVTSQYKIYVLSAVIAVVLIILVDITSIVHFLVLFISVRLVELLLMLIKLKLSWAK